MKTSTEASWRVRDLSRLRSSRLMFGMSLFSASRHARSGASQVFSEFSATFESMSEIWGCSRQQSSVVPFAVGAYITAAYWFTASTSFANPAVALARAATDTFSGIRPADVLGFIAAQLLGAGAATALFRWMVLGLPTVAPEILVPHAACRGQLRRCRLVQNRGRHTVPQRSLGERG
jgi:Major intrinsic protein